MIINIVYLPAAVTGIICFAIVCVCICRLAKIEPRVLRRVGLQYVVLLMASSGLALAPFLWEFPGWAAACFAGAVLFMLLADSYQWRHGPPDAATGPAPLGEH